MTRTIRVDLELSNDEIDVLVSKAIMAGFKRENPQNKWTQSERRQAVRFLTERVLADHARSRTNWFIGPKKEDS